MAKRKRSASVKEAADRAARKSAGVEETEPRVPIDPPVHAVHPGGRPTEYRPEFVDTAIEVCTRGGTMAELADRLGVSRSTIYVWRTEHQGFADAIRVAKDIADERVEFSMYERAVGYTYDSVKILQNAGVPVVVPYKEHVPPDVAAQKHWLSNRRGDKWRDVAKIEHTGKDGGPIETADVIMSETERARRVAFILHRATKSTAETVEPSEAA